MDGFGLYWVFGVGSVAFVALMGWLYASTGATTFLGMAGFGVIWAVALVAAVLADGREPEVAEGSAQPARA